MLFLICFHIELLVLNAVFNLVYLHNSVMKFGLFPDFFFVQMSLDSLF